MSKYARKLGPHWVDVHAVPGSYPDLATLERCLPGGGFVAVDAGLIHGAAHNDGDGSAGTYTNPTPYPAPAVPVKTQKLSWEEFRKLFTEAELEALDSYDMAGCAVTLTDAQKIKIRAFIKKGEARGADRLIDVTTAGMANAIDYLVARGFVSGTNDTRKNEILGGTVKS